MRTAGYVFLFLILTGTGCHTAPEETDANPVPVQLKWRHQAQFAGIYLAEKNKLYAAANLNVFLKPRIQGQSNREIAGDLVSGRTMFAVMGGDVLLNEIARGNPLVAVAVIFQRSPYVYASLKTGNIRRPEDLIGKKIMLPPDGEIQHNALMKKLGIPAKAMTYIDYERDGDHLKTGKIDVQAVYRTGSALALERAGLALNFIWVDDYGIRLYADAIVTTRDIVMQQPGLVERFLKATLNGWRQAIEHPEQALDAVLAYGAGLIPAEQERMLRIQTPLIHTGDYPIGWMVPEVWKRMPAILKISENRIKIDRAFTMDFLYRIYGDIQ